MKTRTRIVRDDGTPSCARQCQRRRRRRRRRVRTYRCARHCTPPPSPLKRAVIPLWTDVVVSKTPFGPLPPAPNPVPQHLKYAHNSWAQAHFYCTMSVCSPPALRPAGPAERAPPVFSLRTFTSTGELLYDLPTPFPTCKTHTHTRAHMSPAYVQQRPKTARIARQQAAAAQTHTRRRTASVSVWSVGVVRFGCRTRRWAPTGTQHPSGRTHRATRTARGSKQASERAHAPT